MERSQAPSHLLLSVVLLTLAACAGGPTGSGSATVAGRSCSSLPYRLVGLRATAPEPAWSGWYDEAEACSGHGGSFARVRWFLVDRIDDLDGQPTAVIGISCADDIYLVSTAEANVRHEILHHVLDQNGHPAGFFPRCAESLALAPQT